MSSSNQNKIFLFTYLTPHVSHFYEPSNLAFGPLQKDKKILFSFLPDWFTAGARAGSTLGLHKNSQGATTEPCPYITLNISSNMFDLPSGPVESGGARVQNNSI